MKAKAAGPPTPAEAYKAALGRLKGTRANVYRSVTEEERRRAWLENREIEPGPSMMSPNYRDAENFGEWLDDRVIAWGQRAGDPVQPLVITVLEAARESIPAAVGALRAAEGLDPAHQFVVFENLELWRRKDGQGRAHGGQLAAALLAEWDALRLPTLDPAFTAPPKRRRRAWEKEEATA